MSFDFVLWGALAILAVFVAVRLALAGRTWMRFHGTRLITCPETRRPAAVEVAATDAAIEALRHRPRLHLKECSRWPERADCGQDCLSQIQAAPEGCLIQNIVSRWYAGKKCVYCRKTFGELHWHDHPPALRSPEKTTVQWNEVAPERLLDVLETHQPVCWNCHVAESFRRAHPDLVTDRSWKH